MGPQSPGASDEKRGFRSDQLSGLMLLALALYVGWESRVYPLGSLQEPGPGYLPLLLAVFLGATGLLIALWGFRSEPLAAMQWTEARRAVVILVACAVATFALERLGYRLTVLALLVWFMPGIPGMVGGIVSGAFIIAYALMGLAVLHDVTRPLGDRVFILSAVYLILFVFWPASVLLAIFGISDQIFDFRKTASGGLPPAIT